MRSFWHPVSALYLPAMGAYATTNLTRMLLGSGGGAVELVYGGDRMWPAVSHGERLGVTAVGTEPPRRGEVVVVSFDAVTDLLRVAEPVREGRCLLRADADPGEGVVVGQDAILARTGLPRREVRAGSRSLRRLRLDLGEALGGDSSRSDETDPAGSVRTKYDLQAPYYAEVPGEAIDPGILREIRDALPRGGRVLVVGSGTGRECFSLAEEGFRVSGLDFSAAMVEQARRGARERNLELRFIVGDARTHQAEPGSMDGIVYTFDVFSFVPGAAHRIELLRKMRGWLSLRGVVFLSARRVSRLYERAILTAQWIRRPGAGLGWGASHTRYLAPDGTLRRSFVHYFTSGRLRRETARAGFRMGDWTGGHVMLSPSER